MEHKDSNKAGNSLTGDTDDSTLVDVGTTRFRDTIRNRNFQLLALLVLNITISVTVITSNIKTSKNTNQYDKITADIDGLYNRSYINGSYSKEKSVQQALKGYVEGIGDKYGNYMTPNEAKSFENQMEGELTGIGVEMNMSILDGKTRALIKEVYKGSPSEKAGMKAGGYIVKIDEISTETMNREDIVNNVRGKTGTDVKITVDKDGVLEDFNITRGKVEVPDVKYEILEGGIGYVQMKSFGVNTSNHFKEVIEVLKTDNINKYIFDLRDNSGGLVDSVVDITDEVVPEGIIAKIVDKEGKEKVYKSDKRELDGEMVVLVNGNTASAAELFTLALRDYGKAVVVGEQTYGKGTQVSIVELRNGGMLALSSGLYYTKTSPNIEGIGITPDIEIKADTNSDIDIQLNKAKEELMK